MKNFQITTFRVLTVIVFTLISVNYVFSQEQYKENKKPNAIEISKGGTFYPVQKYDQIISKENPKNVILFIGDGMGLAHIYAAMTANGGSLFIQNFINCGFSKTYSSSDYVTDSGAGGTALACGVKTYNGAIGVDENKKPVRNIREMAEAKGMKTGLVSTSAINHATPASFLAHQVSRNNYEEIAAEFLKSGIDVFIGGGIKFFEKRKDGRNLSSELRNKGFKVLYKMEDIQQVKSGKLAGLTAEEHDAPMPERGEILVPATQTAINILSLGNKGFFLMVEGSEIDFLAHNNSAPGVVNETKDLDRAIGAALAFAAKDRQTLIIVTADHETGGMTINEGNNKTGDITAKFSSPEHTGVCVPVFAFGPGADQFGGFMENTDIPKKIMKLLNIK